MVITPENTIFVALCFEGPDDYSMAGGLGDRISHLTHRLAGSTPYFKALSMGSKKAEVALVLDKYTADEILFYTSYLRMHPEKREMIRAAAKETAKQQTWKEVLKKLLQSLEFQGST